MIDDFRLRRVRPIPILFALLLFTTTKGITYAQDLTVVSTTPAEGSSAVLLESTIAFEFSTAIDTSYRYPGGLPVELFAVSPPDSIVIERVHYSADLTTVLFDVRHTPDTDYLWILTGARTKTDTLLCAPGVINYTTAQSRGSWAVRGTAAAVALVKRLRCGQFRTLTALIYDQLPTNGGKPIGAAIVDANNDYRFSISGVRNGVYWPAVITDINENGVIEPTFPRLPELEFYRALDNSVKSIVVADADVDDVDVMILVGLSSEEPRATNGRGLLSSYPNPFSGGTNVEINIRRPGPVQIRIYDLTGRLRHEATTYVSSIGRQALQIELGGLPSGPYVGRVHLAGSTHSVLLVKVNR
ncbi:MAG: T9SS type A sorting domain-containing protein [Rhodothermia bacterium]|nr:T9SS type A sorting domain-containing protein [Rhodothermia bacterium]